MRIEKLKAELEKAWQKAAEGQGSGKADPGAGKPSDYSGSAFHHSFAGGFRGCFRKDQSNERPAGRICR